MELRQAHFDSLRQIVPAAWFFDDAPLQPGAVIFGLGIAKWADLPRKHDLGRFELVDRDGGASAFDLKKAAEGRDLVLAEKIWANRTICARFARDAGGRIVLEDVAALS
ncbi:MAG: hypothetical protein JNG86_04990 [Verrucomicrobiaceae bacterium]|nr:hypothetical protein [Verrucomicrobiaceae bacterium]